MPFVLMVMLLAMPVWPASAGSVAPCGFTMTSVSVNGKPGNRNTFDGFVSRTGRYVAFATDSSNIVSGDTNGRYDIFVRDLQTGTVRLEGLGTNGQKPNGDSTLAMISPNGRYVAFSSTATNLYRNANGEDQVFLRDRQTNKTILISKTATGAPSNHTSVIQGMTPDGRYVVFSSQATNMGYGGGVHDFNFQVYVRDVPNARTILVSVGRDGRAAEWGAFNGSISDNGRQVAFESMGSNLVPGDTNRTTDIFVRDIVSRTTKRISVKRDGSQAGKASTKPIMTPNGRFVLFTSWAAGLVTGDTNGQPDVFIRDRSEQKTRRVSVGTGGTQANGESTGWSISDNGRYVTFTSFATNLDRRVAHEINGYARDTWTGRTRLYTICDDGTPTDGWHNSDALKVSGNGSTIILPGQSENWAGEQILRYHLYHRPFSVLPPTLLTTSGPYRATFGQDVALSARLQNGPTKAAIGGVRLIFDLLNTTGTSRLWTLTAVTGNDGRATVTLPAGRSAGRYVARVTFAGNDGHAPVAMRDDLVISNPI